MGIKGKVWLVGAGPGDAELLTIKGRRVLNQAEVVLFDKLVGYGVLSLIPKDAETIDVGKIAGNHPIPQQEINKILLEQARGGKRVVRLKGGDPFLFGRGGEELELLERHGIPFEVIPGISSAMAVPAYFGIPVTHRDFCSSVHIITGHKKNGEEGRIPYQQLVKLDGTLIFLMGVKELSRICEGLLSAGIDPNMPAAVLERGTTARQRGIVSTVSKIGEVAATSSMRTPAIIVVGRVCSLSQRFSFRETLPLFGQRILVTRPKDRASALTDKLTALGAEVVELPAIRTEALVATEALKKAIEGLSETDCIAFTSPVAVGMFFDQLFSFGMDARCLGKARVAVIGQGTAKALKEHGLLADIMPPVYCGKTLGEEIAHSMGKGGRVILPRAQSGTQEVLVPFKEMGISYQDIPIYETLKQEDGEKRFQHLFEEENAFDWVTFTSASTVYGFVEAFGSQLVLSQVKALCIGEQTAQAAVAHHMNPVIAKEATIDSMVEVLIEEVTKNGIEKEI